jgi:hypothetical protein
MEVAAEETWEKMICVNYLSIVQLIIEDAFDGELDGELDGDCETLCSVDACLKAIYVLSLSKMQSSGEIQPIHNFLVFDNRCKK